MPHFGYTFGYQVWLYIAFAFWSADRFARLARIAYYNRLGSSKAVVEVIPGCDIMQVTVFPRVAYGGPGQHSFLYIPGLGRFWESHPFSIVGWKKPGQIITTTSIPSSISDSTSKGETTAGVVSTATELCSTPNSTKQGRPQAQKQDCPSIQFLIRTHAGLTSTLRRRLLASPSGCSLETSIYTEGPYAGHRATLQPLYAADTVLCLVGGIGITHVLGFVQEYTSAILQKGETSGKSRGTTKQATRFILAWSAKESALIDHVKQNFLTKGDASNGIEYSFWCTGPSNTAENKLESIENKAVSLTPELTTGVTAGRMDVETVIRSSLEVGQQTTVLVCGPGNMTDEATRHVVNCVKDGFKVDLVEEAYAW